MAADEGTDSQPSEKDGGSDTKSLKELLEEAPVEQKEIEEAKKNLKTLKKTLKNTKKALQTLKELEQQTRKQSNASGSAKLKGKQKRVFLPARTITFPYERKKSERRT